MLMSVRCNTSLWLNAWWSTLTLVCVLGAAPGDGKELHTLRPCLKVKKKDRTSSQAVLAADRDMHLKKDICEMRCL